MTKDDYAEARGIAHRLDEEGLASDAASLRLAIDAGSTGSEILMALRWHLQRIEPSNPAVPSDLKRQIRDLARSIAETLGA